MCFTFFPVVLLCTTTGYSPTMTSVLASYGAPVSFEYRNECEWAPTIRSMLSPASAAIRLSSSNPQCDSTMIRLIPRWRNLAASSRTASTASEKVTFPVWAIV